MLVAICDDIINHAEELKNIINSIDETIEIDIFTEIDKLFEIISVDPKRYYAIFMDMDWGQNVSSGVDYITQLHNQRCKSKMICVTAFTLKYIEKLFWENVKIFGVINKPIERESVQKLMDKLNACSNELQEDLVLNYNDSIYRIPHNDIVYVKSEGHKISITTIDGEQDFYISLKSLVPSMPDKFYMVNKGILVNMDYVKRIEGSNVVLSYEGKMVELPIGSKKKTEFKDRLFEYISR